MRKFALAVIALCISGGAFAQGQPNGNWGVKGGLNMAMETVPGVGSTDMRLGLHIGVFTDIRLDHQFDFRPEMIYSMQGAKYMMSRYIITEKLDYINVPLMIKIFVNKNRKFSIDFGPQVGFLINAKISDGTTTINVYNMDNYNKVYMSLNFGLSYKFNYGWEIGTRDSFGLSQIISGESNRNNVGLITFGHKF